MKSPVLEKATSIRFCLLIEQISYFFLCFREFCGLGKAMLVLPFFITMFLTKQLVQLGNSPASKIIQIAQVDKCTFGSNMEGINKNSISASAEKTYFSVKSHGIFLKYLYILRARLK